MGKLLGPLRNKIHNAVRAAALDMQGVMDYQLEYAMLYHPWKWKGVVEEDERVGFPYSNSPGNGANGSLFNSKEMSEVIALKTATGMSYAFSWRWNPTFQPSGRSYAALVHDGSNRAIEYQMYYNDPSMNPIYETYSARPWTAWVTPMDQRSKMNIETQFVQPVDVPDTGWQFARDAFVQALRTRLNGTNVRISL
jgi:hypothetical protein